MGGKGGGGGDYYAQPADTSGYGTPEEAKASLAREAPLDLSGYQQTINTKKAADLATAPDPSTPSTTPITGGGTDSTGGSMAAAVLKPPDYWSQGKGMKAAALNKNRVTTTQT
jgi:hypothetical protein